MVGKSDTWSLSDLNKSETSFHLKFSTHNHFSVVSTKYEKDSIF